MSNPKKDEKLEQISQDEAVVMLLAGPPERVNAWYTRLQIDTRFRVNSFSTDPQDLEIKLGYNPEAILIDSAIFSGPESLIQFLTRAQCALYVILPKEASEEVLKAIRELPSVKGVYLDDINLTQVAGRIYAEVTAMRLQAPALEIINHRGQGDRVAGGLRVISVWNRAGGCGKSTVATALALDSAQRGIRTLLVGLSAPDLSLPTFLNLKTSPNIFGWFANPTYEGGLKPNVHTIGNLDVLVGLQDGLREKMLVKDPEESTSINQLVIAATFGGYSVVILDTPTSYGYVNAISASNTMVLVSLPMLDQAVITAEAYRIAFKRIRDQHRIGAGNVYVMINRFRKGLLDSNEWHGAADAYTRAMGAGHFPPVVGVIPDVPEVQMAANAGRSPLTAGETFAAPIHRLGDILFGVQDGYKMPEKKSLKIGPIHIRGIA